MRFRLIVPAVLVAAIAAGCYTMGSRGEDRIEPTPGSTEVKVISQQRVSTALKDDCERLGAVRATIGPREDPETEDGRSKVEIKARNRAHELGATHLAVGTQDTYPCFPSGKHCGHCGLECFELPATAYRCEREDSETRTHNESDTRSDSSEGHAEGRPKVDGYKTNVDPSKYMSVKEAASYCETDADTVWGFVGDDILSAYHTEHGILLPEGDVKNACEQEGDGERPTLMTVDEAAEFCGTESRHIWEDLEDGTLTARQTENGIRIAKSEVAETCDPAGGTSAD